jgi:hypothetical protein
MKIHYAPFAVGLLACSLMPASLSAQQPGSDAPPPAEVRRPYRGLFGGPQNPTAPQSLIASASLYGAYDDNVMAGVGGVNRFDPRLQRRGEYVGASAGLTYALARENERSWFGLTSGATANGYFVDADRTLVPHAHATALVGFRVGRYGALRLDQQAVYSQYYRFLVFPSLLGVDDDGALAGDGDLELFERRALRSRSGIGFSQGIGSRSTLSAGYAYGIVNYIDAEFADWRSHNADINYARRLTARATLNLGYGHRRMESSLETSRSRAVHDVNAGVTYSRALSFSRRTSFSFSTGSAILVRDDLDVPGSDPRANLRLLGDVVLNHEMGRTWTAQAAYKRGIAFREGFDDPFLTDALSAGISGLITRRLDLSALARWSFGKLDRPGRTAHDGFVGTVQARYALARYVALFARYLYYQYEFGPDVPLDPGLARSLDRQGVRVGVTASVPLIR